MFEVNTIGLDIAKKVFHTHGTDSAGSAVFSRRITQNKLLSFFAAQPKCLVALEACGSAHHWARELRQIGHDVRLIPPAYVKPFVKRQKNDAADAEAICESLTQMPRHRSIAPAAARPWSHPCLSQCPRLCNNIPSRKNNPLCL